MRILVRFAEGASEAERADAVRSVGGWIEQEIPAIGITRIALPGDANDAFGDGPAVAAVLAAHPAIAHAEYDGSVRLLFEPNDTYYRSDPYSGLGQWGIRKAFVDKAWDKLRGSDGVTVAILDTGIDAQHPDLISAVAPGQAFVSQPSSECDPAVQKDDNSHGTHVAGIVGASGDNGTGVAGVAFGVKVMGVKVLDCTGMGEVSDIANGIVWATDHGARILNLSLGTTQDSLTIRAALDYAASKDVLVVAAVGNCGVVSRGCTSANELQYPGAYPDVLGVGSFDEDGEVSSFSSRNASVDVVAPGREIVSTTPTYATYTEPGTTPKTRNYAVFSGTSQAAPFVAGVAALVWSADPGLAAAEVAERIRATAVDIGAKGRDDTSGSGRVNAQAATSVPPRPPAALTYAPAASGALTFDAGATTPFPVTVTNTGTTTWSAAGPNPVRLSYHWLADGRIAVWDGLRAPLTADLAPGASATLALPVMAPETPGAYTLRLDLVEEGVGWFSARGFEPRDLLASVRSAYVATYSAKAPPVLLPGGRTTIPVTLINTGTATWAAAGPTPVHLAAHVTNALGEVAFAELGAAAWDGTRTTLAADVPPGATVQAQLVVDAPLRAGPYRVRIDLVREGLAWFSSLGVATGDLDLLVAADTRATLPGGPISVSRSAPTVSVTFGNAGIATWTTSGVAPVVVSAHWLGAEGAVLVWDGPRTALPQDLGPGESVTLDVALGNPPDGAAFVTIDLVSEGLAWFGEGPRRPVTFTP